MKRTGFLLFVWFVLPITLSAQVNMDISYWLEGTESTAKEAPDMEFKSYELNPLDAPLMIRLDNQFKKAPPILSLLSTDLKSHNLNWQPTTHLNIESNITAFQQYALQSFNRKKGIHTKMSYKLSKHLSLELSGYYLSNKYKSRTVLNASLYQSEIAAGLAYNVSDKVRVKSGFHYMYNTATRRWEHAFISSVAVVF